MVGMAATIPEDEAGARLTIALDALTANWRDLAARAAPAACAAVVKADAYGTGLEHAVPALWGAGCRTFFVALPVEARRLRAVAPAATIYVLSGLLPGAETALAACRARPVLGSLAEIARWAAFCGDAGERLPAAIHIDTGMNRLGLSHSEVATVAARRDLLEAFETTLIISHLACADTPDHPLNAMQVERFEALRRHLPAAPASLANSGGTLLGAPYLFDLVRPGIALYGGRALADRPNPMRPVVRLDARIVQLRSARAGETVGYGGAQTLRRDTQIAVLSAGYGDGYLRAAGASNDQGGATAHIDGHPAPILGRVSMDSITIDVTDVPDHLVQPGAYVELLGPRFSVDDLAERAGTIGYEVLTSLGRRYHRAHMGASSDTGDAARDAPHDD